MKCTIKQVLAAIKNSGGIKTNIARKLHVSRFTIDNYQKKYPSIAKAIEEERWEITDKAESNIFTKIQNGDIGVSQWFLRYKGGYVEKSELTADVKVRGKVETKHKLSPQIAKMLGDALSDEKEKLRLAALSERKNK